MPHTAHTNSAVLLGRRFARWGALALLSVIIYEVTANLALRRALGALEQRDLSVKYDTAYTFIPGRIVVHGLRVSRNAELAWSMTAERVELRLTLADFLRGRLHVQHAHVTSATLSAPPRAPSALRTSSTKRDALSAASFSSGGTRERRQSLWVELLTGTARHLEVAGLKLERGVQLEVRGLSTSGAAINAASASFRLHETALGYDGAALATVMRGEIRSNACGLASVELRRANCRVDLDAKLVPAARLGLSSPEPFEVHGRLETAQGGHARGEMALRSKRAATLRAGGRSWDLPRGFSAQLDLSRDAQVSGSVSAAELSTSDQVVPGFQIQALTLDLDSSFEPATGPAEDRRRRFRARFRLERGVLTGEKQVFRSPLQGALLLESAPTAPRSWTIRSGTLDFSSLSVESSQPPREVAPLFARVRVDSGLVSFVSPVVLEGALELSGTELNSLLKLAGLPESVGYMLSRFQHQPFELAANLRREPTELWLRNLVLSSAGVRMEGALELSGPVHHGALLVTIGRSTLGVQLGEGGAGVALSVDRAWLLQQIGNGGGR